MPPPSVSPRRPAWTRRPPVVASPCACVASLNAAHVGPPSARAVLRIDLNVAHAGQVDDDRVVGGSETGDAVPSPADWRSSSFSRANVTAATCSSCAPRSLRDPNTATGRRVRPSLLGTEARRDADRVPVLPPLLRPLGRELAVERD